MVGGSHQRHLEESGAERENRRPTMTSSLDLAMRGAEAEQGGGGGKTYREEEQTGGGRRGGAKIVWAEERA